MYVISAHQRYRRTDGQTDAKRWHDRSIAILAWSGKNRPARSVLQMGMGEILSSDVPYFKIKKKTIADFVAKLQKTSLGVSLYIN